jgi:hypothetical protein
LNFYNSVPIIWKSNRQRTISLSTTEAELDSFVCCLRSVLILERRILESKASLQDGVMVLTYSRTVTLRLWSARITWAQGTQEPDMSTPGSPTKRKHQDISCTDKTQHVWQTYQAFTQGDLHVMYSQWLQSGRHYSADSSECFGFAPSLRAEKKAPYEQTRDRGWSRVTFVSPISFFFIRVKLLIATLPSRCVILKCSQFVCIFAVGVHATCATVAALDLEVLRSRQEWGGMLREYMDTQHIPSLPQPQENMWWYTSYTHFTFL